MTATQARKTYNEILRKAGATYHEAVEKANTARDEAVEKADKIYLETVGKAGTAYLETLRVLSIPSPKILKEKKEGQNGLCKAHPESHPR